MPVGVPFGQTTTVPVGFERYVVPRGEALQGSMAHVHRGCAGAVSPVAFDIETSGGLGRSAVPFLLAAAWHESGEVRLVQWTLRDPNGEAEMLVDFARCVLGLAGAPRLLSFNGGSFDLPVLRTRMRRLGVWTDELEHRHVDLLVAVRRLWREALPNCRLSTLEARILRVHRCGDMPGVEVAEVFPQLLASPRDPWVLQQLERARRHNRGDVLSLLGLAASAGARLQAPCSPIEALRAARHYLREGKPAEAVARLEGVIDQAGSHPRTLECELRGQLAESYRRVGQREAAAAQWRWLVERSPPPGGQAQAQAHEHLAKYLEHVVHDYAGALQLAQVADPPCARRITRLERKLAALRSSGAANGSARS